MFWNVCWPAYTFKLPVATFGMFFVLVLKIIDMDNILLSSKYIFEGLQ